MRPRLVQGGGSPSSNGMLPLLTLRPFVTSQTSRGGVAALTFLSSSLLACGDRGGTITVLDLHSRRPRFSLSCSRATTKDIRITDPGGPSSLSSSFSPLTPSASPVLLVQGVGPPSSLRSLQSPNENGSSFPSADARGELASPENGRLECLYPWLLSQHRSSVVTAWDLQTLEASCSLRTGAYSFCKLAVLEGMTPAVDGDERLNVKDDPAADEPRQDLRKEVQSEPDRSRGTDGKTIWPSPFSEGNARGPLPRREVSSSTSDRLPLLACPVADSEAIGIYDLRVPCHCARLSQPSVLLKCSSSLSSFNYGAVAGGSWDGGGWGMVQCLAGVSKLGPTPHVAAAYELPCVALWDIRQPRCPLSQIPLPPSSPPSCLAVFRNRLWVGCFDGDLTVLDIRRDGTFRLPPRDHIHLSGEKEFPGRSCCSSAPSGLSSLPHPEGDVSHAQLLLSAAFRPDGALVAVGASDGAFRLFETKTGRCLGSLSPRDAFRTGSEAAGCCLAWCESTGVLATGCGGGRIVLWGPYLETYGGRRCQKQ